MRSIVYGGRDFSEMCCAEVVARSADPIACECMRVPGRAGSLLTAGWVPPVDVEVRLLLDPGHRPGRGGMAGLRARMRSWLCLPGGGTLVLPDDPEVEYADALLVGATGWSDLFEAGSCTLTFTLFDPVGYGMARLERGGSFEVGGTWRTWPSFRLVADEGELVSVALPAAGRGVEVEGPFAGGEVVEVDCGGETVFVDGADARGRVALGSDFFALEPGAVEIATAGCSACETSFRERWI